MQRITRVVTQGPAAHSRLLNSRQLTTSRAAMSRSLEQQLQLLKDFSACDVSDALLKLEKPAAGKPAKAGYLADIVPYAPSSPAMPAVAAQPKIIARASTLKLIDKSDPTQPLSVDDPNAIPKGSHWADETDADTVLVIEQPSHQTCAAVGGIMASRMKARGVKGCIVGGRVRDLVELKKSDLPIWASGRSTVGSGAESKVYARNIPVTIKDISIVPGDIIFCDPVEGIVAIPQALVNQVIDLMPKLVAADDNVKRDVEAGSTVQAAFKKHRN